LTYKISIPLNTTIEIEVDGEGPLTYEEIIRQITDVDLKEAALQVPKNDIRKSFIKALLQDAVEIEPATA
tara:strand:- start:2706 stop:2915 length:210 start_codon:yes stop_codon:yes gene_type:complete